MENNHIANKHLTYEERNFIEIGLKESVKFNVDLIKKFNIKLIKKYNMKMQLLKLICLV